MTKKTDLKEMEGFIKALGSENRLKILMLFMDGRERTVNEITHAVGIGQSTCSEHLAVLKKAGLMNSHKMGKEVLYLPNRDVILGMLERISGTLKQCC
ncbi:MAG: winged helix-turn-helix transcriptional regulator [Gammaproteobacteria bacterium]|nr:winged helix-turn-helix transcriptional regulator [Gammaproteobacteria bacterium]